MLTRRRFRRPLSKPSLVMNRWARRAQLILYWTRKRKVSLLQSPSWNTLEVSLRWKPSLSLIKARSKLMCPRSVLASHPSRFKMMTRRKTSLQTYNAVRRRCKIYLSPRLNLNRSQWDCWENKISFLNLPSTSHQAGRSTGRVIGTTLSRGTTLMTRWQVEALFQRSQRETQFSRLHQVKTRWAPNWKSMTCCFLKPEGLQVQQAKNIQQSRMS